MTMSGHVKVQLIYFFVFLVCYIILTIEYLYDKVMILNFPDIGILKSCNSSMTDLPGKEINPLKEGLL